MSFSFLAACAQRALDAMDIDATHQIVFDDLPDDALQALIHTMLAHSQPPNRSAENQRVIAQQRQECRCGSRYNRWCQHAAMIDQVRRDERKRISHGVSRLIVTLSLTSVRMRGAVESASRTRYDASASASASVIQAHARRFLVRQYWQDEHDGYCLSLLEQHYRDQGW